MIAATIQCRPVVVVNIGANKGYSVAHFVDLFVPNSGFSPTAVFSRIIERWPNNEVAYPCGACDDCKELRVSAFVPDECEIGIAGSGVRVPSVFFGVDVHALEPVAANVEVLNVGVARLALDAQIDGLHVYVHRVAAVGDATLDVVPFSMCPMGLERCGVEPKGTNGSISTWNHDQVIVENVKATTVDAMSARLGINADMIDILAIDTEGFDPDVLRGARTMLSEHRIRVIEFEYHKLRLWKVTALADVVSDLETLGYDCFFMQKYSLIRLTGCFVSEYEFHDWANVLCVVRTDAALLAIVTSFVPRLAEQQH